MEPTTCAACKHLATNVYPWWFYVGIAVCLAIVIGELAVINWTRWTTRATPPGSSAGWPYRRRRWQRPRRRLHS